MVEYTTGMLIKVAWGLDADRFGEVVEVWGDATAPTHLKVRLDPLGDDDEPVTLLLNPRAVFPAVA